MMVMVMVIGNGDGDMPFQDGCIGYIWYPQT